MRVSFPILAIAATAACVSAQASDFEDRRFFTFSDPTACESSGCKYTECGSGECAAGATCGNFGGKDNTCCEAYVASVGLTLTCGQWKETLEAVELDTAATEIPKEDKCGATQNPITLSTSSGGKYGYNQCCPSGQDGVVLPTFDEDGDMDGGKFYCIPSVEEESSSSSSPSSSSSEDPDPSSTSSSTSSSQTPNSATRLQNFFIAIPAILMTLAAF